jgi:hypothetical protein
VVEIFLVYVQVESPAHGGPGSQHLAYHSWLELTSSALVGSEDI